MLRLNPADAAPTALIHAPPIRLRGFASAEPVRLRLEFSDELGQGFAAEAHFCAMADGTVDSASCAALAGSSYTGVDAYGLYWSALPCPTAQRTAWLCGALRQPARALLPTIGPLAATHYRLRARGRRQSIDLTFERFRAPPTVTPHLLGGPGWRGVLWLPSGPTRAAAVLVIGGSEGGLPLARAAALACAGVPALAVGTFAAEGLPPRAIDVPLEHYRTALEQLCRSTQRDRAVVFGASRGSEAALLVAALWPERVSGVVAWTPTAWCHPGLKLAENVDFRAIEASMWSLDGRGVPCLQFAESRGEQRKREQQSLRAPPGHAFAPEYAALWTGDGPPSARLPVERIRAPALLVSSDADALWPSGLGARQLKAGLRGPVKALRFADASHSIGVPNEARPFAPTQRWLQYGGVERGFIHYGGSAAGSARASRVAFRALCRFVGAPAPRLAGRAP
jgi:pimeloyl-ACP methyl ester carboxylesterase